MKPIYAKFFNPVNIDGGIYPAEDQFADGEFETAIEVLRAMRDFRKDVIAEVYTFPQMKQVASYAVIDREFDTWFDGSATTKNIEWTNPEGIDEFYGLVNY